MSIISWAVLIALAFIFIFVGLALVMFFAFYFNDGGNFGLGAALFLLIILIIAAILPNFTASPIIPASITAGALLVAIVGTVAHFFLPYLDSKDVIMAVRPLIRFSIAAGVLVAVINLAKIVVA